MLMKFIIVRSTRLWLRTFLGFSLLAAFSLLTYWLFDQGYARFNYPSRNRFPVRGVDISHHQGQVDWQQLKLEGFLFAFIKATEGGDFKDKRFLENWERSRKAGILRGAYHFFTFCRPGDEQAANFLATVPAEMETLPIVLDLEFGGNCKSDPSFEELLKEINSFLLKVKPKFPETPIFYVTKEFYNRYMSLRKDEFPEHHLWLRDVFAEPMQQNCERWKFWQFANRGRVNGITGAVDLNVFCSSEIEFRKLFRLSN